MTLIGGLSRAQVAAAIRPKAHHLLDPFDVLSPRWQVVGGTLAVDTGALKASALADWGNNLVSNGESWTGGPPPTGWTQVEVVATAANSAEDPGAPSGGIDPIVLKVVKETVSTTKYANAALSGAVIGAFYQARGLLYAPSSNTAVNAGQLELRIPSSLGTASLSLENVWQSLSVTGSATATTGLVRVSSQFSTAIGDTVYADGVTVYRRNAAAIAPFAPAFRKRLVHIPPAAGVLTPAGWMFRYTDALNYWELRVVPNTAGNDLQIVQVTAGVSTVRAEADVDWTADQNDEVLLTACGSNITTAHRKYGASVWTAGPSYAAATQGIGSPWAGPLQYDTTRRWGEVEVWW